VSKRESNIKAITNGTSYNLKADLRTEVHQPSAIRATWASTLNLSLFGMLNTGADARILLSYLGQLKMSLPFSAQRYQLALSAPTRKAVSHTRVAQNDVVVLAGRHGTWKVVAPVNGTKADICRRASFDTRIVTALVESLTVVCRAGSPECGY
jgi:hypothetical protein